MSTFRKANEKQTENHILFVFVNFIITFSQLYYRLDKQSGETILHISYH